MDLKHLEYIVAIADEGTLSGAARRLYLSQPNLSMYLKKLEQEARVPLFWRVDGKYIPTPAGEHYLENAHRILELAQRNDYEITEHRNLLHGTVRIGCAADINRLVISEVIPLWLERFPNFSFIMRDTGARQAEEMLLKKQLDAGYFQQSGVSSELTRIHIVLENFLVAVPKKFGLAQYALPEDGYPFFYLPPQHLDGLPFILQLTGRVRENSMEYFYTSRIHPRIVVETQSMQTAALLCQSGVGCTFLNSSNVLSQFAMSDVVDVFRVRSDASDWIWKMSFTYRTDNYMAPLLREMADILHDHLAESLPAYMMAPKTE